MSQIKLITINQTTATIYYLCVYKAGKLYCSGKLMSNQCGPLWLITVWIWLATPFAKTKQILH